MSNGPGDPMTIDGLIGLAPFVVLPVVLLLGFVGCSVPDVQFRESVILQWDTHFNTTNVDDIDVRFTYEPLIGEAPSNLVAQGTFAASDFVNLVYIDLSSQLNLNDQPDGTLR